MLIACTSIGVVSVGLAVLLTVRWIHRLEKRLDDLSRKPVPRGHSNVPPQGRYRLG